MWVGWVTPDYHQHDMNFDLSKVRAVTVTMGDEQGNVHSRCQGRVGTTGGERSALGPWLNSFSPPLLLSSPCLLPSSGFFLLFGFCLVFSILSSFFLSLCPFYVTSCLCSLFLLPFPLFLPEPPANF